jgi:hypothetical protein
MENPKNAEAVECGIERPGSCAASRGTWKYSSVTGGFGGVGGFKTSPSYAAKVGRGAASDATLVVRWPIGICPYTVTAPLTVGAAVARRTLH